MLTRSVAFCLLTAPVIAQSTWLDVSPLKGPSRRSQHVMAYDANRGVVVLFGGRSTTATLADTWEWDGYLWTQRTPATSPPARTDAAMVYDAKRKKIVLFGGRGAATFADTWEWDGFVWTRKSPTSNPSKRHNHAMAYDSGRDVVVMFGGLEASNYYRDTWEWNGTTWIDRKVPTTSSPLGRYGHGMAYDAARKQTVIYAGWTGRSSSSRDTWQWNGTAWTKRAPTTNPLGYSGLRMEYDAARKLVLCFGGYVGGNSNSGSNDTYEWDGGEWTRSNPKNLLPTRWEHAMAYDSKRRRLVVFGGRSLYGQYVGDTWELVHDCIEVGQGHPGGGLPITCLTPPLTGSNFRIAFGSAGTGQLFIGQPVTTPFATFNPPIVCRPGTLFPNPLVTIPGTGKPVILNLPIPNNPNLIGTRMTMQGASRQVTGCFLLSDAVEVTVRHP